jgi:PAS domain S-box-containing protein
MVEEAYLPRRSEMEFLNSTSSLDGTASFSELLTDLLTNFINLPVDQIDFTIEDAQRQICDFYGFERSTLWQVMESEPDIILLTHIHQPTDQPVVTKQADKGVLPYGSWINLTSDVQKYYLRFDCKTFFPWVVDKLKNGDPFSFSCLDDLPEEATIDREMFRQFGSQSMLSLPLFMGREWLGILTFATLRKQQEWSAELIALLKPVAQIFSNIIARKRADQQFMKAELRLTLAAAFANADLWEYELAADRFRLLDRTREVYGFASDEEVTLDRVVALVHADDCETLRSSVQEALDSEASVTAEFRVKYPDESYHWVVARGRGIKDDNGTVLSLMGATIDITERKRMEEQIRSQCREIKALKKRLEHENLYLQQEIKNLVGHGAIISHSAAMLNVISLARQVACTESKVLILGETGTGKELLARAIHDLSEHKSRPLITVNCASLPSTLIEAELFGREKGAYTGAVSKMTGRFELADGSTIFLDEIGELPLELQAKLLRVIDEGVFQRLGSPTSIKVSFRIIAATNRNLSEEVKSGRFRSDLYYRLSVFPITIPPLRERPEDIPPLIWSFVREFQETMGKTVNHITDRTMNALTAYHWPGNVRELRNVIERAMIISKDSTLEVKLTELKTGQKESRSKTLRDVEREQILTVLADTKWRVGGKGGAAELLGLERTTLHAKMKKLGIRRPLEGETSSL